MIKIFRFFGKLVASILVLLFLVCALISILLLSFESQLLNPDFYLEVFEEVDFFDRLPEIAAVQIRYAMGDNPCLEDPANCENDELDFSSSQGGPPSYFQALSEKDWELLLTGLLPQEWLEDQIQEITGNLFNALESGEGDLTIKISMVELKNNLSGEAGIEAIAQLLEAQPECSKDDLLEMTRILEGREAVGKDFLTCQPPAKFIENYTPQLEVIVRRSLRDVPDEIDLGKGLFDAGGSGNQAALINMFGYDLPQYMLFKWIQWSIRMSPLFCVTLLLIIALLAVHSYKALGVWWGYPLAISGLIGIVLAMLVGPLSNFLTNIFLGNRTLAGISPVMIETGSSLAVQLIKSLFTQVRIYSIIAAGLGLGIIIISAVVKSPEKIESEKIDETESKEPEIEESDKGEAEPEEIENEESDTEEKEKEPGEADIEETDKVEAEPEETENEESAAGKKEKEPEESDYEETEEGPE